MRVEYTARAASNLRKAIVNSRQEFGDRVASELAAYIRQTIERLALHPESAPVVTQRPGLRAQSLGGRYPYVIFYRVFDDKIRIVHIRHASRRSF